MEWDNKIQMVKALNGSDFEAVKALVLDNIDNFDAQAWDMFLNGVEFIQKDFNTEISFWRKVWSFYLANKEMIEKDTSFRAVMRTCLFETLMEDWELKNINPVS